jgi:hypothetical protein
MEINQLVQHALAIRKLYREDNEQIKSCPTPDEVRRKY